MDLSQALTGAIVDLCSEIGLGPDRVLDPLRALSHDLRLVTKSYLGLQLVLTDQVQTTTLTSFAPLVQLTDIHTSLHLPLTALSPSAHPGSALTLYASAPGAFVDLAADLAYAHRSTHQLGSAHRLRLDRDLVPRTVTSGVADLDESATVNRAIGWLIDRGYELDAAPLELARGAAASGTTVLDYATGLIRSTG